jgi:hypothetical protein
MKRYPFGVVLGCAIATALAVSLHSHRSAAAPEPAPAGTEAQIAQLREQIKQLESLVPDQAAVMTKVAYHFTNLYIAVEKENWPLADFYLGETRNNIKWAVRAKPIRKDPQGREIDLGAIAQAIDNTQLTDLKNAIAAKDKPRSLALYEQTLSGCYGCHTASGKPYLHLQKPTGAEVTIVNFDPKAQ